MAEKADVYSIITDRIVQRIETEGILPWSQPWRNYLSQTGQPQNLISKKPYRGMNVWVLSAQGYGSPFWLSFKQAQALGGSVRKGQKGTPVVFWLWLEDKDGGEFAVPRYYTVFNAEQCDGLALPALEEKPANDAGSLAECERVMSGMPTPPTVTHNEAAAYYHPVQDRVNLPRKESFAELPRYYATAFHELAHSTGHPSRLDRLQGGQAWGKFGSDPYAKEELVAEMTAAFLCGVANIEPQVEDQSVAYLQGWVSRLKGDSKLLIQAAAQAQRAADYILGTSSRESERG